VHKLVIKLNDTTMLIPHI